LDDAFNHNEEEMKKAAEAARRGDRTDTKKAVEVLRRNPLAVISPLVKKNVKKFPPRECPSKCIRWSF